MGVTKQDNKTKPANGGFLIYYFLEQNSLLKHLYVHLI